MRASSLLAFRCYFDLPSINKDFTSLHFTSLHRRKRLRRADPNRGFLLVTYLSQFFREHTLVKIDCTVDSAGFFGGDDNSEERNGAKGT